MCGIAAFVDFQVRSTVADLKRMNSCLVHRGPDGEGIYFKQIENAVLGLAHRRLSILDLSKMAAQPMEYGGLHLIFNGEIYNYAEIRTELIKRGHSFKTNSDSEVVLHSLKEWGMDAVKLWHGMFAAVLYDQARKELICIRDRAGVKPLFYTWREDVFLLGSELKTLVSHPAFNKELNLDGVASFLKYGYITHPDTIYKETYKLPPGCYIRLSLDSKELTITRYWDICDYYRKPKLKISFEDALEETEKRLAAAFNLRMVSDVPVGVFLSGGYDSACLTSLLQKNQKERLKTFTIGTYDDQLNEAQYAKEVASYLGTDHTEYYCDINEALQVVPELPYYFDEPFGDSSAIPTILVSRLAKQKVTVALSADGGDEIFGGYDRYLFMNSEAKKIQRIPKAVRRSLSAMMEFIPSEALPLLRSKPNFHNRYNKLKSILADPTPHSIFNTLTQRTNRSQLDKIINGEFHHYDATRTLSKSCKLESDAISYMMTVDFKSFMNDDVLHKVDRATMSVGLEGREPFLDQNIVEWAATLPTEYKVRDGVSKYILKSIVHRHIPRNMIDRPKKGFTIPIEKWLKHELKDLVWSSLNRNALAKHSLLNEREIQSILNKFYSGRSDYHYLIWNLLMFQLWYEKWIGN